MRSINPIGTIAQTPTDQSDSSWLAGSWWQQLQPGSWRDIGFVMDSAPTKAGRRIALHEYAYRDTVWPEDLGKLPRRFQLTGFLTGDDCYEQKRRMIAACEEAGPGTLVHPVLGSMQCVLLEFTTTDRRDRGRYVEVEFEFIAADATALAPAARIATGEATTAAADALDAASAADLSRTINTADPTLIPAASTAFVRDYAKLSIDAVNDPARSLNAVTGLKGLFGRYSTGRRSTLLPETATVSSALSDSITSRQAVLAAADTLIAAAGDL